MSFYVGFNVKCEAHIETDGVVHIEGEFTGSIEGNSNCILGKQSSVSADIAARTVVAAGIFEGNIYASDKISVLNGAHITGSMRAPSCNVECGGRIYGDLVIRESV